MPPAKSIAVTPKSARRSKAEARPVKTDLSAEGLTIVSSGVTEGETVVTGGQYKLQAGGAVVVQSEPQPAS